MTGMARSMNLMSDAIIFEVLSSDSDEFIHEFAEPGTLRLPTVSQEASTEVCRGQIKKLRQNILHLRSQQALLNEKIEDYVRHVGALIEQLESDLSVRGELTAVVGEQNDRSGTTVKCLSCDHEKHFPDLEIIFARESDESLLKPTQCYVRDASTIKKGIFRCLRCGGQALMIRPQ